MTGGAASLRDKVCLVTGATAGIGFETARALAGFGATVVVLSRNAERCAAAVEAIRNETGNPAVEAIVADLSSQADVRRAAREFQERFPCLDVLVNNAGAAFYKYATSVDGIEMTWALNHLGYFLLTNLLLDTLKASAPARVVNVASDAHRTIPGADASAPPTAQNYRPFRVYASSKLANILFTRELAHRLKGTGVTANAMHPGLVASNFAATASWPVRLAFRLFGLRPEQGARTAIYLATAPEVEGVTGEYFIKEKAVRPSARAVDDAAARSLWEASAELTGLRAGT